METKKNRSVSKLAKLKTPTLKLLNCLRAMILLLQLLVLLRCMVSGYEPKFIVSASFVSVSWSSAVRVDGPASKNVSSKYSVCCHEFTF